MVVTFSAITQHTVFQLQQAPLWVVWWATSGLLMFVHCCSAGTRISSARAPLFAGAPQKARTHAATQDLLGLLAADV